MKKIKQMKKFMLCAGIFGLVIGITGCSDDDEISDDDDEIMELPTGMIQVENEQNLSGTVLTVQSVTVGQDSWLAAVKVGELSTNNFIAQPERVVKGTTTNVQLVFDETAIDYYEGSQRVVLKLYADNLNGGIIGEWDASDRPIKTESQVLVYKKITIYADLFEYYDINDDGTLDVQEVSRTYPDVFSWWVDDYGHISYDNFYSMIFYNTETSGDYEMSEVEWNEAYHFIYRNWVDDSFLIFDLDKNELLSNEEWEKVFYESQWFENYDANSNNVLTRQEIQSGFFRDWDLNKDGKIDEDEFNNYRPYVIYWEYLYWVYN